jgi:hypothetical protein
VSYEDEWVSIPEFPKYSVNPLGQVKHNRIGRLLTPQINQIGVPYVCMVRDWEQKKRSLALLVARAFIPQELEGFNTPIHLDGDHTNCSADNLMWRPRWFAIKWAIQCKAWPESFIKAPLRDLSDGKVFRDSSEVSRAYGVLEHDLWLAIANRTYVWPTYQLFDLAE